MRCFVQSCDADMHASSSTGFSTHRFPKDDDARLRWWEILSAVPGAVKLGTKLEQLNSARLCSRHFCESDIRVMSGKRVLKRDAVPRLFLCESDYSIDTVDQDNVNGSIEVPNQLSSTLGDDTASTEQFNDSTRSLSTVRYAGDMKDVDNISPEEAKAVLPKFRKQLHDALKRNKRLKQQNYRLKKKFNKLETILNELKRQNIVSTQGAILLKQQNKNPELLKELSRGPGGNGYASVVRTFATTVFFYSTKAYNYVREAFNFTLPHPSTIIRWYRGVDGNPGLTTETLQVLEVKANEKAQDGLPLLVDVTYDECAMRQQVTWNPFEKKFDGIVDLGSDVDDNEDVLKPAREILVFMVTSVDESWKIPVAYYVINGVNVEKKKALVGNVLNALHEINVIVIGLTFDGTSTNIGVANALGCHIRGDQPLRTSFRHPSGTHQVHVILDACHMVKLVRNVFASQKTLRTNAGKVEWELVEKLIDRQNLHGLKLAKNLTDQHVNFNNMKMKVVLAVQLLSNSTGNALETLKEIDVEFADCDATVEFIRVFNGVFDILNSRPSAGGGFKRPMCAENFEEIDKFLEYAEVYIRSIIIDSTGKPVLQTCYKTGFLGILVDIRSFREMFHEYVTEKNVLCEISTYRFSQDHLEMFFGGVRAKGGCNDNPNFVQFKAAYKRMLNDNAISVSSKANILEIAESEMLVADVAAEREQCSRKPDQEKLTGRFKDIEKKLLHGVPTSDFFEDEFINAAVEVDARSVQKEILRKVHCQDCLRSILHDQEAGSYLSDSIVQVCRFSEVQLNILTGGQNAFNVGKYYNLLIACSIKRIEEDFPGIVDIRPHLSGLSTNHLRDLLKVLMDAYFNIRLTRYSQQVLQSRISIRPKLNKIVHFNGY